MKTKFLKYFWIPIFISVFVAFHAQSTECLNVHSAVGVEQSFALDNVRKITFTAQSFSIHLTTGSITTLQYGSITGISFKSQTNKTYLIEKPDVNIYREADALIIKSDTEIMAVRLFNLQGKLLVYDTPKVYSTNISLASCPAGIYIIQIVNQEGFTSRKL